VRELFGVDHAEAVDVYQNNWRHIFNPIINSQRRNGEDASVIQTFNFPLDPTADEDAQREKILRCYREFVEPATRYRHKLDVRLGGIVEYRPNTDEVRSSYFYPAANTSIVEASRSVTPGLSHLMSVGNVGEGLAHVDRLVRAADLSACMNKLRKDTTSRLLCITNVPINRWRSSWRWQT
jgi:hypothetical protein